MPKLKTIQGAFDGPNPEAAKLRLAEGRRRTASQLAETLFTKGTRNGGISYQVTPFVNADLLVVSVQHAGETFSVCKTIRRRKPPTTKQIQKLRSVLLKTPVKHFTD